jgi:excinuclease ABC subunit C
MDLNEKIRTLPTQPGVYLYKNAEDEVIYVGKAKNLRSRVRSYFLEANQLANRKTGSLMREAVDLEYILVANEREALALENNLIKQRKPRFNILLRDDKTYPYVKLTIRDRHPKVFVTRKLKKDGALYFGPYFPGNLAYRLVDLIHRSFLIPSCKVDLSRYHPRPCLEYYIKRCLAPCVENLVTPEVYRDAIRDVQLFLEGKENELETRINSRMHEAAASEQYELAARLRDQIVTVHQLQEKQRIASTDDSDADVFGFHFANDMLAVNQFHMRTGKIVDRRDFFFEDLPEILADDELEVDEASLLARTEAEGDTFPLDHADDAQTFNPSNFFAAFLKQLYLDQPYVPRTIMVPAEFRDRDLLAALLSDRTGHKVEILAPQRGEKRSLVDLVCQNAKQSYDQRFRTLQPSKAAIAASLQDALGLADPPKRIECFDISHIQGAETVASMVVWEDGEMKKSDYRKFKVNSVSGVDDFASMHEILTRRYGKLQAEKKPFPSLILIDGGLGQLHAAYAALEQLGITLQPLASIAKREEIIYVHGQEDDPVVLDRRSPVLHLVQHIRDESHRFAVTYHRKRREIRDRETELLPIPGVGPRTRQRLIEHFGSIRGIKLAGPDALTAVVNAATAEKIRAYLNAERDAAIDGNPEPSNPLRILS